MKLLWGARDAEALVLELTGLRSTRLCPRCGSTTHGQPRVEGWPGVSIARAEGMSLVAVSKEAGRIGVDVEKVDATPPADIALHARDLGAPLETWVRKEAVLKALGLGLRTEPSTFWIDATGHTQGLDDAFVVRDLEIPGYVAATAEQAGPVRGPTT